jgi:hypothetical protein
VNLLEEIISVFVSFQHVQNAILGILIVVATSDCISEIFLHILHYISRHRVSSVPLLIDFNKVLRELYALILKSRSLTLFALTFVLLLVFLLKLVLR